MNKWIYIAGFALGLIMMKKETREAVTETVTDIVTGLKRGERLNNPGNIKHGESWQGLSDFQSDSVFAAFVSPVYGIRAIAKIFLTYFNIYGLNTVREIISRYAPVTENPTSAYIDFIAKTMGVSPDTKLNIEDESTLVNLVAAIIKFEQGRNIYSTEVMIDAVNMALA